MGGLLLRYGLVSILLWVGLLKFTAYEARAIQPLVENSPLLSWLYDIFSVRTFSALLGTFEIALALMIAAKPFLADLGHRRLRSHRSVPRHPQLSVHHARCVPTRLRHPVPVPDARQFVAKDVGLLAIAVWTAGEALSVRER